MCSAPRSSERRRNDRQSSEKRSPTCGRLFALEQERWVSRLEVVWNVADDVLDLELPPLLLQPLVENALRHGLGGRLDGGTIRIEAGPIMDSF